MAFFPFGWRGCAAGVLAAGLLALGTGCKSSTTDPVAVTTFTVSGKVTYQRAKLLVGADGRPTGLDPVEANFLTGPARGVKVRLFQARMQVQLDGSKKPIWVAAGSTSTDANGDYSIGSATAGDPTFVELVGIFNQSGGNSAAVALVGDPAGIDSTVLAPNRVLYMLRKGSAGTSATAARNATPGDILNANATVNFAVGTSDDWLLCPLAWYIPAAETFTYSDINRVVAGSRPLAILDSIYTFSTTYGDPTPNGARAALDLHYRPGVSHSRYSFMEYNPQAYPYSYDGSTGNFRYYGTLAGGPAVDDAYNEGVLFELLSRNRIYGQGKINLHPTSDLPQSLAPDAVLPDGLPDAMAAALLKSPFLPVLNLDATHPTRFPARDIRDLSTLTDAQRSVFSPRTVAALTWELILKTKGIVSPGVPADWATLDPMALGRFFLLTQPMVTSGTASTPSDVCSLMIQLGRLQEGQISGEPVNLAGLFTDATLTSLLAPFRITWPGIAALPLYTTSWGIDPDSRVTALPAFTLSMAAADPVRGVFPNTSRGEVAYARFAVTKDRAYDLSLVTVPALPGDAQLEVVFNAATDKPFLFGGGHPASYRVTLTGNPADLTTPTWYKFRTRVISPGTKLPADLQVTVILNKAN